MGDVTVTGTDWPDWIASCGDIFCRGGDEASCTALTGCGAPRGGVVTEGDIGAGGIGFEGTRISEGSRVTDGGIISADGPVTAAGRGSEDDEVSQVTRVVAIGRGCEDDRSCVSGNESGCDTGFGVESNGGTEDDRGR